MWFVVQSIFGTPQPDGQILIQADMNLFPSGSAERAYEEAIELGMHVEGFSRTLGADPVAAMLSLGISAAVVPEKFEPSPLCTVTTTFLGLGELAEVGEQIGPETEVCREEIDPAVTPTEKQNLLAFEPAGPAFKGPSRQKENVRIWSETRWYFAEQLFEERTGCKTLRGVMIAANNPVAAHQYVVIDARREEQAGRVPCRFLGLQELWPVGQQIKGWTELRSLTSAVTSDRVRDWLSERRELAVFREER